jgi:hypothetical protein
MPPIVQHDRPRGNPRCGLAFHYPPRPALAWSNARGADLRADLAASVAACAAPEQGDLCGRAQSWHDWPTSGRRIERLPG